MFRYNTWRVGITRCGFSFFIYKKTSHSLNIHNFFSLGNAELKAKAQMENVEYYLHFVHFT